MTARTRYLSKRAGALSAGLLVLAGCTGPPAARPVTNKLPAGTIALVRASSCADLLAGLRTAAKATVGPDGLPFSPNAFSANGGSPAGAIPRAAIAQAPNAAGAGSDAAGTDAPDFSGTNTAEPGVDEPDLVKTDGHRIVTLHAGQLTVLDPASRRITGTLAVGDGATNLLLAGDRALVFLPTAGLADVAPADGLADVVPKGGVATAGGLADITGPRLVLVDLAATTPQVVSTYTMDGALLDARQVGSTVRVVLRSSPRLDFPRSRDATAAQSLAANRAVIDRADAAHWLPRFAVTAGGRTSTGQLPCDAVSRPADYSGTSMITVLTMNLTGASLGTGDPVTVLADANLVYATGSSLYVLNDNRWRMQPMILPAPGTGRAVKPSPPAAHTELYQFDIAGSGRPRYLASGTVPGFVINQYALSDWQGNLRVASTDGSVSTVYLLHRTGGTLHRIGSVGGLGRGQRIFAVRFDGPVGYVVTFRQTDPLYTLDLRDPAHPAVTGQLDITGYSAYLHPLGNGRLIGVGRAADDDGHTTGSQVSLFDVRNPAAPTRLAQYQVRDGNSTAEFDPHAFLYWPATGLLVIPMSTPVRYRPGVRVDPDVTPPPGSATAGPIIARPTGGAMALHVNGDAIAALGLISHQHEEISRALVVDRTLWTVSDRGLAGYDIGSLAPVAWLAF